MRYPASEEVASHQSTFEAAHTEARKKGFTGSLVFDAVEGEGVVVYLNGWPVYAEYQGPTYETSEDAVREMKGMSGEIDRHASRKDAVEMFKTYLNYIGRDEGFINVYRVDQVEIQKRTILVTKAGNLEKTQVPPGKRVGYSPSEDQAVEYFAEEGASGYALSNNEIIFFEEGEETERNRFKEDDLSTLVRMDSEEGLGALECEYLELYTQGSSGGKVDVEFDIQGWEIVEGSGEEESSGGLLSGVFGG